MNRRKSKGSNLVRDISEISLLKTGLISNGLASPDNVYANFTLVWILGSSDPQPPYETGIWYDFGIWLEDALWYG